MIGKTITGSSFGGCVRYVLCRAEASILEAAGVSMNSPGSTIRDFNIQRSMNPALGKAVGHLVLSWSKEDLNKLSPEFMAELAREYMDKMDIINTQYITVQHSDRAHPHVHIIYNRVNNDRKTISDQFNYKRNEKACKEITVKYGFHIAGGKEKVNRDRLKGADSARYQLYDYITTALVGSVSWKELEDKLSSKGIEMIYKFKSGTEEIQGVSFQLGELTMKGSAIDRSLSYGGITNQLKRNYNRIYEAKSLMHNDFPHQVTGRNPGVSESVSILGELADAIIVELAHASAFNGGYEMDDRKKMKEDELERNRRTIKR